jgi:hypothetical protein
LSIRTQAVAFPDPYGRIVFDSSAPRPRPRSAIAGRALATLACWYAAVILAVVVLVSSLPDRKTDGTCDGLGFGCTPNPRDGAIIVAIVYGVPLLLASMLASAVSLAIAVAARIRSGVAAGTLAAFTGFAVVAGIPAVLSAW